VTGTDARVVEILTALKRRSNKRIREEMLTRYVITAPRAFGVSVGMLQQMARRIGRDHDLALALWETGWYEARMLTAYIGEPERVTAAQMDRWAKEFDNWAICDTLCFALWDRTPHAWKKVEQWSRRRDEFVKRAAFALLACLGLHDKRTGNAPFLRSLALIERAAQDDRNLEKKGVSWALRAVGRRNAALNGAAVELAGRLAESPDSAPRWIGKDVLRDIASPALRKRLAKRASAATK
jgi:3-methyladenine DNA glycosylase AlkD